MSTKPLLLFFQRRPLFPPHCTAAHDHHEGFVPRLLLVRRTTRCLLLFLAFLRTKSLPIHPPLFNGSYAFSIVSLHLLPWSQDIVLRDEIVICDRIFSVPFQSRKLPFGNRSTGLLNNRGGSFDSEVVDQRKICWRKYLRDVSRNSSWNVGNVPYLPSCKR